MYYHKSDNVKAERFGEHDGSEKSKGEENSQAGNQVSLTPHNTKNVDMVSRV
jgi:hypothetical protein